MGITAIKRKKLMSRPIEADYTSYVAYTRALEEYCDSLAQPKQEPVAHIYYLDPNGRPRVGWDNWDNMKVGDDLYALPPQRKWVGLTDEDMNDPKTHDFDFIHGARWAEAKLKARNT
jgi:hypothetical protein